MNLVIRFLKFADIIVGSFAVKIAQILKPSTSFSAQNIHSILFIRPGGIGDAALLMPAIQTVREKYRDIVIHILAERRNYAVFTLTEDINKIFLYSSPSDLLNVVRGGYDVVIDTEQWHHLSALVSRLTQAPRQIGFATNERKNVFTHPVSYSQDMYEASSFFKLLTPLSMKEEFDAEKPFLKIPSSILERVRPLFEPASNRKPIALFPGGSIKERRWGAESFRAIAGKLIDRGYDIVIVGGGEDVLTSSKIAEGFSRAVNISGKLSLPETAAILKRSELLISGDSGILHIAYGLGVKTVSLFGPGREKKWAPRGNRHVVINKSLECSPCTTFGHTPRCKRDAECMKMITVEEVFEKAIELLER